MSRLVTDHLPLLAGAPNGVKKLRDLILELAVRGKLVAQDSTEESAAIQINRITSKKDRLIAQKIIKKPKSVDLVSEGEHLFDTPNGWSWCRLENVSPMSLVDGDWIESKDQDPSGGIRLIQLADIGVGEFKDKSDRHINSETFKKLSCTELQAGDILIARLPSPIGRACIFPGLTQKCITVVDVAILRPDGLLCSEYIVHAINCSTFRTQVESYGKGATRFRIATGHLKTLLIPIPPLAEQYRIVAKVDELMALCDRLETRQSDAQAAHARLVDELLGSLLQARDAEDFAECWGRVKGSFDVLFTTEESVEILASAIRNLAFSGKLLDNPKEEKWVESKLKDVVSFLNGYAFKSEWFSKQGIRLARNINIGHGNIDWSEMACIDADQAEEFKNFRLKAGDILLSLDRPLISTGLKVAVVSENDLPCLLLQRVAKITPSEDKLVPEFFLHWLHSPFFMNEIDPGRSNGVPHISTKQVGNMDLLLPPLEEQHRIVAKITEFIAFCDNLKTRIATARAKHAQLAEALTSSLLD